jgi:hypothetical protein
LKSSSRPRLEGERCSACHYCYSLKPILPHRLRDCLCCWPGLGQRGTRQCRVRVPFTLSSPFFPRDTPPPLKSPWSRYGLFSPPRPRHRWASSSQPIFVHLARREAYFAESTGWRVPFWIDDHSLLGIDTLVLISTASCIHTRYSLPVIPFLPPFLAGRI